MYVGNIKCYKGLMCVLIIKQRRAYFIIIQESKLIGAYFYFLAVTRVSADGIIVAHPVFIKDGIHHFAAFATEIFLVSNNRSWRAVFSAMITGYCIFTGVCAHKIKVRSYFFESFFILDEAQAETWLKSVFYKINRANNQLAAGAGIIILADDR